MVRSRVNKFSPNDSSFRGFNFSGGEWCVGGLGLAKQNKINGAGQNRPFSKSAGSSRRSMQPSVVSWRKFSTNLGLVRLERETFRLGDFRLLTLERCQKVRRSGGADPTFGSALDGAGECQNIGAMFHTMTGGLEERGAGAAGFWQTKIYN